VQAQLTTQDILGDAGLDVAIPGVADISVGEAPRAIGGDYASKPTLGADGTKAEGAADVVRVKLLEQKDATGNVTMSAADVRVGHFEGRAQVPNGGISCSLPVTKTVDKPSVAAGDNFTYTISVLNPFADCDLKNVRIEDTITTDKGIKYTVTSTDPTADSTSGGKVVWNDVGPIKPKATKDVHVSISIDPSSGGGKFTDTAVASGTCATGTATGGTKVTVPVTLNGQVTLVGPELVGTLAKTGGPVRFALVGLMLLTIAGALRLGIRRSEVGA
jgi:uncharacterized repeat protein (TIGR01451 family)